jgi:hypothetical protein
MLQQGSFRWTAALRAAATARQYLDAGERK